MGKNFVAWSTGILHSNLIDEPLFYAFIGGSCERTLLFQKSVTLFHVRYYPYLYSPSFTLSHRRYYNCFISARQRMSFDLFRGIVTFCDVERLHPCRGLSLRDRALDTSFQPVKNILYILVDTFFTICWWKGESLLWLMRLSLHPHQIRCFYTSELCSRSGRTWNLFTLATIPDVSKMRSIALSYPSLST